MDEIPISTQFGLLAVLLVVSGFFAMAETAMMAVNRHRLRHAASQGGKGAQVAVALLGRIDKLISMILLCNTLINAAAAMLTGHIALAVFGHEKWALEAGTLFVTFCLLVFSEITPKVVGATYPDWLAPRIGHVLAFMLRVAHPVTWFVNLFVVALLKLFRLQPKSGHDTNRMSPEELRAMVLESGHFIPAPHRHILVNLFDLEHVTVADIMTPRGEIEGIDLEDAAEDIRSRLATSFHSRLPVYEGEPGNIVGMLQVRRLIGGALEGEIDLAALREQLSEPYFIPASTPIYAQLQFFRDNRQRTGLVVDEYGELLGLVTLEDIIEEIVGKFTTGMPGGPSSIAWLDDGSALVDGSQNLREVNRALGLTLPTDGPKTLNGLIVEHLQDIPEVGVGLRIGDVGMEIVQTQDRRVKIVRIKRPYAADG
ncbi:HlyC/CorC family transporter [Sulfurisoma sediminicola]|uniref:Mg2+/Co2+ transporter CorB n=1 Tax=Sulfurisoma sediminicola TaxID=1381557 RepID=A0A497XIV1_9PROT|nr:CNNM domain-containing protein [Sulfurisoma sediminicola]RLJ67774.1 Mg2+/Co2+ transporter CorB [Sulfurisoma sediminicola]